ncbi:MAG: aminopeptidase, partial [Thermoleophilaceae bacterium]|nr:aminopeptidase [Thermoleophilaceae bacterium]
MKDQRADALAQILVQYSTKVQKGDVCVIQGQSTAEPLVQAVYEEVLRAGGLPILQISTEGAAAAFYELADEQQLEWIPPTAQWAAENADVRIAIMADANSRELSQA